MLFSEKVIAQTGAFFVGRAGGQMPVLKLLKLLYLADRESLDRFGHPISFDALGSMDHGPVLSRTLDFINGFKESSPQGWDSWILARADNEVAIARQPTREALDELSNANLQILENVWARFGHMNKWQIRDYTHDNCPEWRDPNGGYLPIFFKDIFVALGKEDQADELMEDLRILYREDRVLDRV